MTRLRDGIPALLASVRITGMWLPSIVQYPTKKKERDVNYQDLNGRQRRLLSDVEQSDLDGQDFLIQHPLATAKDKAAVAEVLGGTSAGEMFRKEHISKRSRCSRCKDPIHFFDGIRDPYWVHSDRRGPDHPAGQPIEPNDAHTKQVYERQYEADKGGWLWPVK
ncbi:hypothetical protein GCM10010435_44640 [Winogradskya consettensis]|uniref:Uncharacterized protein n=1 Tax=Winogradskya consettensis TaxID=113560 RepID=A0A919VZW2_9ACTN|nr:hypothetical protein [Actinoplanes consettensis]GIM82740.1 hypothetical protein Aco04nite_83030 [Actinoplanes consettensis]